MNFLAVPNVFLSFKEYCAYCVLKNKYSKPIRIHPALPTQGCHNWIALPPVIQSARSKTRRVLKKQSATTHHCACVSVRMRSTLVAIQKGKINLDLAF